MCLREAHLVESRRQVARLSSALVDVAIILRNHIDVVKDDAVPATASHHLDEGHVHNDTFVEHLVVRLHVSKCRRSALCAYLNITNSPIIHYFYINIYINMSQLQGMFIIGIFFQFFFPKNGRPPVAILTIW